MKKLTQKTSDRMNSKLKLLAEVLPEIITETENDAGEIVRGIDFDKFRQDFSTELIEDTSERYQLNWPGKRASLLKANTPLAKTLRPDRASSVDFDTTQNLFIEGDNFEALKILQESYLGKVKMIYIDPPYNTGKDFVYSDNFTQDKAEYDEEIEAVDEAGNKMFRENTRTNPRFHSDWLSMMYERLIIARDLLQDDGVIFISIDDNEVHNLRKVCDEIFGESNFIANFLWEKHKAPKNDNKYITLNHEYILFYGKKIENVQIAQLPRSKDNFLAFNNPDNDSRGVWISGPLLAPTYSEKSVFEISSPSGNKVLPPKGKCWSFSKKKVDELIQDNRIWFGSDGNNVPRIKRFLNELSEGVGVTSVLLHDDVTGTQKASNEFKKLFNNTKIFTYPKPVKLLQRFLHIASLDNDIILDFFSGSATTAHAVMAQNAEDGGSRKFIMVQLTEETPEGSEASKAGYKTIAELGRERIRRAAAKIRIDYADKLAERETPLDTGFRAYTVADTAFLDVERHPAELEQAQLIELANNIKNDRTPEDLLTQVMLELGLTLDLPIEQKQVAGNEVFFVGGNALVACFDSVLHDGMLDEIAKIAPLKLVLRDATFGSDDNRDEVLTNVETRMKRISPETFITVL